MICERSLDVAAFAPMKTHDLYCIKRKASSILVIIDEDNLLFYLLVCLFVQITLLTNICPQSSSVNSNFKGTLTQK